MTTLLRHHNVYIMDSSANNIPPHAVFVSYSSAIV